MSLDRKTADAADFEKIAVQEDGTFTCPRCNIYSNKLKTNVKRHLEKKKLCKELAQPTTQSINITNNINNINNVTNNMQINLNHYGKEDQSHLESLTYPELKKILKLTPDHDPLLCMIAFIHLNKDVPENQTIKLDDKDSSVMNVYEKGAWTETNADAAIYDLICRNRLRFIDLEEILSTSMASTKFEALSDLKQKIWLIVKIGPVTYSILFMT